MKKVCFVSSTRADYGILSSLMDRFKRSNAIKFQLIVTGSHLSEAHGMTVGEIQCDGFLADEYVSILSQDDSSLGICKSAGEAIKGISEALAKLKPDLLILLGDRYEILSAAIAAAVYKIPVAHIHGGEVTEGAMDEMFRHSITKLSLLHFTSTEAYRNRVVQLGEHPSRVWNTGALGVENALKVKYIEKSKLFTELGIPMDKRVFLITYHPETLSVQPPEMQIREVLKGIEKCDDVFCLFTKANADTHGSVINSAIEKHVNEHPENNALYDSLGYLRYLNLVRHSDLVLGNSSSGIIEVPSFGIPTVNIGNRQKGRISAKSVVDVPCEAHAIEKAIHHVSDEGFQNLCRDVINPYEKENTASSIYDTISVCLRKGLSIQKIFYDLDTH